MKLNRSSAGVRKGASASEAADQRTRSWGERLSEGKGQTVTLSLSKKAYPDGGLFGGGPPDYPIRKVKKERRGERGKRGGESIFRGAGL